MLLTFYFILHQSPLFGASLLTCPFLFVQFHNWIDLCQFYVFYKRECLFLYHNIGRAYAEQRLVMFQDIIKQTTNQKNIIKKKKALFPISSHPIGFIVENVSPIVLATITVKRVLINPTIKLFFISILFILLFLFCWLFLFFWFIIINVFYLKYPYLAQVFLLAPILC